MMEINGQVAATAWKIWLLLYNNGPQTLAQLRRRVNRNSELLSFSVGWLAREDKVEITRNKKSLRVQLRKAMVWQSKSGTHSERSRASERRPWPEAS